LTARVQTDRQQRRTLLTVLALNAGLAGALCVGGVTAGSSALLPNAVDHGFDGPRLLINLPKYSTGGGAAQCGNVRIQMRRARFSGSISHRK